MDGILVGRATLIADDPLLTARPAGPRTATRVVLTGSAEGMPEHCRLLESIQAAPILIVTTAAGVPLLTNWRDRGAEVIELSCGWGRRGCQSALDGIGTTRNDQRVGGRGIRNSRALPGRGRNRRSACVHCPKNVWRQDGHAARGRFRHCGNWRRDYSERLADGTSGGRYSRSWIRATSMIGCILVLIATRWL